MPDQELALNVAQYGGGGVASTAVLYKLWQVFRGDNRKSRIDAAADELRDDLAKQITELRLEMKVITERCDKFAAERNAAVEKAATTQAVIDGVRARLEDVMEDRKRLQMEMTTLRLRNDDLVQENIRLQSNVKTLTEMLTKLTGMPSYDWNNVLPSIVKGT